MYETRKQFLKEFQKRAGIPTMEEADRLATVLIGLIKARIGPRLSAMIAENVPMDLAIGWENIALPAEAMELQEMMFELDEVGEEQEKFEDLPAPEYG